MGRHVRRIELSGDGKVFDGLFGVAAFLQNFISQAVAARNPLGFFSTIWRKALISMRLLVKRDWLYE